MKIKSAAASAAAIICAAVFALPVYAENAALIINDSSSSAETSVSESEETPDSSTDDSLSDDTSAEDSSSEDISDTSSGDISSQDDLSEQADSEDDFLKPADSSERFYATLSEFGINWAKVRITPVENAQYYEIRNTRGNVLIRTVTPEQVDNEIILEGLAPAKSFKASVTAFFADGSHRVSEKFNIRTKALPIVSNCTVSDRTSDTTTSVSATVHWTPVDLSSGISGFAVCDGTTNEVLATVNDPRATSAVINDLPAGAEMTVCVRTILNQNGETFKSAVSMKRKVHCRPQTPVLTFNNSDPAHIKLSFNACQGAEGYMIYTSTDGVNYRRVSIRKGNDNTSYTLKNVTPGVDTFVRVRGYKNVNTSKFYSSYSNVVNVKTSEQRTTTAKAVIYPTAGFSETNLGTVAAGQNVYYLGTSGRWVKISYKGITGYIYNKAMGVSSNKPSSLTLNNMDAYVDDVLFDIGATPQAICTYVNTNCRYAVKDYGNKTRDQRAYEMLRYRSGSCYYFAALSSYMLERAGYSTMIIDGASGVGYPNDRHNWVIYNSSVGWRHFDACPMGSYYAGIVWAYTDAQLLANRPRYRWDRSAYPAAV